MEIESGLRVDLAMQVGDVTQTVEVTAEAPLIQPGTSSLGQVVESRTVTELPLNGRNPVGDGEPGGGRGAPRPAVRWQFLAW